MSRIVKPLIGSSLMTMLIIYLNLPFKFTRAHLREDKI
uniref:Uncharacterized protein n=1 Tax=Rhizophora mucronata TaxID=61149 RepID=A0A2P2NWP9_RHIMU